MKKTFYLVSSCDKEHGDEVIGLFDNEEQAETAAALEELKIKDNKDYNEYTDFITILELEIDTKDYRPILSDYLEKKEKEKAEQLALQKEMQKDIEPIKVLMEAYKEKYGAYPQL